MNFRKLTVFFIVFSNIAAEVQPFYSPDIKPCDFYLSCRKKCLVYKYKPPFLCIERGKSESDSDNFLTGLRYGVFTSKKLHFKIIVH